MKLAIVLLAALFIGAIAVSGCTSQSQQPLVEPTTHTTVNATVKPTATPTTIPTATPVPAVATPVPSINWAQQQANAHEGANQYTPTPTATPTPTTNSGWKAMRGCTPTYVMQWVENRTIVVEPAGWTPASNPYYQAGVFVVVTKPCSTPL